MRAIAVGLMIAAFASGAAAQRYGALQGDPATPNLPYDGRFTFARLRYTVAPGGYYYRGLPAWAHGYSHAEENLLAITHEVSMLDAHRDGSNVLAIDDPALFKYPVSYMTEAGYWVMSDREGAALRKYLLRGGFLILDDTRDGFSPGNMGMANIDANFRRMFPDLHFVDISIAHPIFHSFFDIASFSIVPQYYDRGVARFLALFVDNDPNKRLLVLLNFNTDVSNFWEFSATGFEPIAGSNEAYKLGVNYLIYALTH
jgi:Domain of unknown function (DUF4159)